MVGFWSEFRWLERIEALRVGQPNAGEPSPIGCEDSEHPQSADQPKEGLNEDDAAQQQGSKVKDLADRFELENATVNDGRYLSYRSYLCPKGLFEMPCAGSSHFVQLPAGKVPRDLIKKDIVANPEEIKPAKLKKIREIFESP